MRLRVDLSRPEPAWQQLVHGVLDQISADVLAPGARLPSVRGLAQDVRLNPNTVARAYRELEVLGAVEGRQGRGVFVTSGARPIARRERGTALEAALREAVRRAREGGLARSRVRQTVETALRAVDGQGADGQGADGRDAKRKEKA